MSVITIIMISVPLMVEIMSVRMILIMMILTIMTSTAPRTPIIKTTTKMIVGRLIIPAFLASIARSKKAVYFS